MTKLNVNPKVDTFEEVNHFIEGKTTHQLKIFVRDVWKILGHIANATDNYYPELSEIIDCVRDGGNMTEKMMGKLIEKHKNRYTLTYYKGETIIVDRITNSFHIRHKNGDISHIDGMNTEEYNEMAEKRNKKG